MKLLLAAVLLTLAGCKARPHYDYDWPLTCITDYRLVTFKSVGGHWVHDRRSNSWTDLRSDMQYSSSYPEQCYTTQEIHHDETR